MFCSKCGNVMANDVAFCPACGAAMISSTPPSPGLPGTAATGSASPAAAAEAVSPHWLPPTNRAYAGFWLRVVGCLIDGLILGAIFGAICIPIFLLTGLGAAFESLVRNHQPDPAEIFSFVWSILLVASLSIVAGWLYYAYFESSDWQGTVGKKAMSLVVTDLQGGRISFGRASGRYFSRFITKLIPFGIGYILAGVTEKKQALHDMIASCLVLRS
ncbi:MAG TPA: RDD family protein [Candidatus Acidoferrum sp.]|jgi:uncharacterized RDD family membrane protein YckC